MKASVLTKIAPDVKLGTGITIYDFVNLYGCDIGDNTQIGTFVEIEKGSKIGKNCKIQSHTFICEGVTIEDNVFVGHNVTFINDRFPRATTADGRLQREANWYGTHAGEARGFYWFECNLIRRHYRGRERHCWCWQCSDQKCTCQHYCRWESSKNTQADY